MKNSTSYILLIFSLLMYGCNNAGNKNSDSKSKVEEANKQTLGEGFRLMEGNCFACHSPNATVESKIAPTMATIKKHYLDGAVSEEQFTNELISFLNNPSKDNSKIPDAVERYNLMPKMSFSDAQISNIASYIYASELEQADWFEKHYKDEKAKYKQDYVSDLSPIEMGKSIAMKTKGILGKNLLGAIKANGTESALSFCSTRAIHLTDSMSMALHADIKRVSDKNRNPDNKANSAELEYIEATKIAIAQGKSPKPKLTVLENKQIGYYPILTNKMCMQCHGDVKTEVLPQTLYKINTLYPNDLATGYNVDELRGIWVVEMLKK